MMLEDKMTMFIQQLVDKMTMFIQQQLVQCFGVKKMKAYGELQFYEER